MMPATLQEITTIAECARIEFGYDPDLWDDVLRDANDAILTGDINGRMADLLTDSLTKDEHWDSDRNTYTKEGRQILRDLAKQGHLEKYDPKAIMTYQPSTVTVDGVKYEC